MTELTKDKPEEKIDSKENLKLNGYLTRRPRLVSKGTVNLRLLPEGARKLGAVSNLSVDGCCVLVGYAPEAGIGNPAELILRVKGETVILASVIRRKRGKARESGELGTEFGLEFTSMSARKAEQISDLVAELLND